MDRAPDPATGPLEFWVHVRPGSASVTVGGTHDGALVVRVSARAERGRANEAVREALAQALGVRRARVEIVSGHRARRKRVRITGEAGGLPARLQAQLQARLEELQGD